MGEVVRFNKRRSKIIAVRLAGVIRLAFKEGDIASLFGLEGPLRASLRSNLCLRGWHWRDADRLACDVLSGAHALVGAERPSWNEGQREWTIEGGTLIERTRCARCHQKLPEGHPKFCSDICRKNHHLLLFRLRAASDVATINMAVRSLY